MIHDLDKSKTLLSKLSLDKLDKLYYLNVEFRQQIQSLLMFGFINDYNRYDTQSNMFEELIYRYANDEIKRLNEKGENYVRPRWFKG
jgi:hypothetical protein